MKAQARLSHPTVSCIARRVKAVRSRFRKSGAGREYLTQLRRVWLLIVQSCTGLYGSYFSALKWKHLKSRGCDFSRSRIARRTDRHTSGFYFVRNVRHSVSMGTPCGTSSEVPNPCFRSANPHGATRHLAVVSSLLKLSKEALMPISVLIRTLGTTPTVPRLYTFPSIGLNSGLSVKATDTGLRNLKTVADNRRGRSQSGFLFIRNLSHLLMGVACSCDLSHGYHGCRISQNCNAAPTRLRNGRAASQTNTMEAHHA